MQVLFLFLTLGCVVQAADTKIGTLSIDQKLVAKNFILQPMYHTEEVKPNGTVLDGYCGTPQEMPGTKVCVAILVNRPKVYYVVLHRETRENIFVRSSLTVIKTIPPIDLYSGFGVASDETFPRYSIEKHFDLELHD